MPPLDESRSDQKHRTRLQGQTTVRGRVRMGVSFFKKQMLETPMRPYAATVGLRLSGEAASDSKESTNKRRHRGGR